MGDSRPSPPSWIDKELIQTALRVGEDNPTLTVSSFQITMANAAGDGYSSDMYRVIAKLEDYQERRIIVKCHPQDGGVREDLVRKSSIYDVEIKMFVETLPAMCELLNVAKPGEYEPFAAKCLYHGNDPVPFIVLEDLRQSGFTLAKREGMDLAHASLVIKTLANFHAASLALHSKDPKAIEWYDKFIYRDEMKEFMGKFVEKGMKHLSELLSKWPGYEQQAIKVKRLEDKIFDKIAALLKRKEGGFHTLVHGDAWINNMMFKYTGNIPADMRLVDFQLAYYGSPTMDLHYFLYACISDDVRIHHMDELIAEYHATLTNTLEILGCSNRAISLAELKDNLNDHLLYAFMSTSTIMPLAILNPDDGFEFETSQTEEGDEIYRKIYSNEIFAKALRRMLPMFEEKGFLES